MFDSASSRRRRIPSAAYYSPGDDEWQSAELAQHRVAVFERQREAADVARHVAQNVTCDPFFVMHVGAVRSRVAEWSAVLPRVQPFYPLKCNADPVLARLLADCPHMGFEAADREQLDKALELMPADRVLFSSPVWTKKLLRAAAASGCRAITVTDEAELMNAVAHADTARILIRLRTDVYQPECAAGIESQVGADVHTARQMLVLASELRAKVVGVSVHAGASCAHPSSVFHSALSDARELFDVAGRLGLDLHMLNVGGGFAAEGEERWADAAYAVSSALARFFPLHTHSHVDVFATPGRFISGRAFSLCTNIVDRQIVHAKDITEDDFDDGLGFVYRTNDGVDGSFACQLADGVTPSCRPLFEYDSPTVYGRVLGGSCQLGDVAQKLCRIRPMSVGEWLLWDNMGSYSIASESDTPVYYYADRSDWDSLVYSRSASPQPDDVASGTSECDEDPMTSCDEESEAGDEDDLSACFDRVFHDRRTDHVGSPFHF